MNNAVYLDAPMTDDQRRKMLYEGQLVVYSPRKSVLDLVAFARGMKSDPRPLPRAKNPIEMDPQIRFIVPVGGMIIFSGAQMHASVPNTSGVTRFSIDFCTVHRDDVVARAGAPNVDSHCTGTTMHDYMRGTDFERLPDEVVRPYDDGTETKGVSLYEPV